MRKFPRKEAEVAALARQIVSGFIAKVDDFPSPPLAAAELQSLLDNYKKALDDTMLARAAVANACAAKDEALKTLLGGMKTSIRYAEDAVKYDDAKLTAIGWSGRKKPTPMAVPGQAMGLEVIREGSGWISLKWKKPKDGGVVATYQVQVSHEARNDWRNAGLCFETETKLEEQERGVELKYRVVAINKAGEGVQSNTVTAVL